MGDILTELLPRKVRLWLYVLVFLALAGLAAWQAAAGDLIIFSLAVLGSLSSLLAAGNVTPEQGKHEAG